MPYKDKERAKEYNRNRMRVARDSVVQPQNVQPKVKPCATLKSRPNGPDYNPGELLEDGRKRYLECSDGQVLDRTTVPGYKVPSFPKDTERIEFIRGELNDPYLIYGIERVVLYDMNYNRPLSREQRYENALRYHEWHVGHFGC